jgi:AcrR family transcriptional regulator
MGGRKAQGEQTRRAIIDAAIELYADRGFRGTGLMAIGEAAGVAHATVLYHYGSSHELLMAVLAEREKRFRAATRHAWAAPGLATLRNLPEVARFNVAQPELAKLFAVLQAENLDEHHEANAFFRQRRNDVRDLLRASMRIAIDAGEVRPDVDVDRKVDEILSFTTGAQIQHWLAPDEIDLVALFESYTDSVVKDLTRGVRKGRRTPSV